MVCASKAFELKYRNGPCVATGGPTPSQLRALNTRVVTNAHPLCSEQPPSAARERNSSTSHSCVEWRTWPSPQEELGAWFQLTVQGCSPTVQYSTEGKKPWWGVRLWVCSFYSVSHLGSIYNYGNVFLSCLEWFEGCDEVLNSTGKAFLRFCRVAPRVLNIGTYQVAGFSGRVRRASQTWVGCIWSGTDCIRSTD